MAAKPRAVMISMHRLKVTLEGITPPVWRRFEVPSEMTLGKLHRVLQKVVGWEEEHLHVFRVGARHFGQPDPTYEDADVEDERAVTVAQTAPAAGAEFEYLYDFGDSWEHRVAVEKVRFGEHRAALCLDGARACPPEDCGGPRGYEHFLAAIEDPSHEDHEEMLAWVGGTFDPEAFDLETINRSIRRLR